MLKLRKVHLVKNVIVISLFRDQDISSNEQHNIYKNGANVEIPKLKKQNKHHTYKIKRHNIQKLYKKVSCLQASHLQNKKALCLQNTVTDTKA